ncbi:MAG: glycosyltransferase [Pseudomonadota bacterium]
MRILHYNWDDCRRPSGQGGGVSVYQRAVMDAFARLDGVEAVFLCAGLAQSLRPRAPRWEALPAASGAPPGERRFQLVDSLPLAPAHHSFGCAEQVDHPATVAAFADFVDAHGPFDFIHFNTLEGLPASVLALRARWPGTRMIVALHNYYPFCPQVNLWRREAAHCADFEEGAACVTCLPVRRDPARLRQAYGVMRAMGQVGLRQGNPAYDRVVRPATRAGLGLVRKLSDRRREAAQTDEPAPAVVPASEARAFSERRSKTVQLLNTHADCVVAVSDRTAEIARGFGIRPDKVAVCRIGTDQSDLFSQTPPKQGLLRPDGTLGLGYLGYMRRDKGFFFLLDTLEGMAADLLARIHLTVAAVSRDPATAARVAALGARLAGLRHLEGYSRGALDHVLDGVDLGVVPVLWEDNLPQVAMEMHARRIPLLTSDLGGARELGNDARFVFRAGDAQDFTAKLRAILAGGADLAEYWRSARALRSPEEHARDLLDLYRGLAPGAPRAAV